MEILKVTIHYSLHFLAPGVIAYIFFREYWKRAWGILILTMLVDLDHLLASPIFEPERCSIGFHLLHTYPALGLYVILFTIPKTRLIGLGLLFHMLTDYIDCLL